MDTIIGTYLEQVKVGRKQSYKNLALYPLLSTYSVGRENVSANKCRARKLDSGSNGKVANKQPETRYLVSVLH